MVNKTQAVLDLSKALQEASATFYEAHYQAQYDAALARTMQKAAEHDLQTEAVRLVREFLANDQFKGPLPVDAQSGSPLSQQGTS